MTTAAIVWNSSGSPTLPCALPVKPRNSSPVMPAKAPETANVTTQMRSGRAGLEPGAEQLDDGAEVPTHEPLFGVAAGEREVLFFDGKSGLLAKVKQRMQVNPLGGKGFENLFRTHPSTEERVARLRAMAGVA